MIATRQRPRRFPWGRLLALPLAVAAGAALLAVPPIHRLAFNDRTNAVIATATAPLKAASQTRAVHARDGEIARLHDELRADETRIAGRDAQAKHLQQTIDDLQTQMSAKSARSDPHPRPARSADPFGAGSNDQDARRTAGYWGAMEPEQAAAVVRRVPEDYAVRVLSVMPPDQAGAILGALPPALAARLSTATR